MKLTNFWTIVMLLTLTAWIFPHVSIIEAKDEQEITTKNPLDLEFTYEGEKIEFFMDVFYFKTANENEYNVEVWYEVPNTNLKYVASEDESSKNKLVTNLVVALNTYSGGEKIENKCQTGSVTFEVEDEKEAMDSEKNVMGSFNFTLTSGIYVIKLGITDLEAEKIGIEKVKFEIPTLDKSKIMFSSFKFAYRIEEPLKDGSEDDIYFVENIKKRIFPNLNKEYKPDSELAFYYEIYNLANDAGDKPKFDINYYFHRVEKAEKEGEPDRIVKLKKQTVNSDPDAKGSYSPQIFAIKLLKEYKDKKSGKMRSIFIPGQYEMIIELVDHLRKDDQKYSIKYNFTVSGM